MKKLRWHGIVWTAAEGAKDDIIAEKRWDLKQQLAALETGDLGDDWE